MCPRDRAEKSSPPLLRRSVNNPWRRISSPADAIEKEAPGTFRIIGRCPAGLAPERLLGPAFSGHLDGMVLTSSVFPSVPELQSFGDEHGNLIAINADLLRTAAEHGGPKQIRLLEQGYTTSQPRNNRRDSVHAVRICSTEPAGGDLQPRTAQVAFAPSTTFAKPKPWIC